MEIIYDISIVDSEIGSLISYGPALPVIPRIDDRIYVKGTNYLVYKIEWSYHALINSGIIYITVMVSEYKERN